MEKFVKSLKTEDFDALEKLAATIWNETYKNLLSQQQIDYMLSEFQSTKAFKQQYQQGYIYRGLFVGEKLVGYSGSVLEGDRVFLSKLYLQKEYRGLGLGRFLLEDVLELYPDSKSIYLTVNKNNPVFELYKSWGFKVIDSVVSDIGNGYVMDDYVLQLDR